MKSVLTDGATITTCYIGNYAEKENITEKMYYYAGSTRLAMRSGSTLHFLLSDQLGSTTVTLTSSGAKYSELRYMPWGTTRYTYGTAPTAHQYTGQVNDGYINLYWYNSRWYDPAFGRWIQPDSIVPEATQGVQAWDRFAYVNNSPVNYNDPSGHCIWDLCIIEGIGIVESSLIILTVAVVAYAYVPPFRDAANEAFAQVGNSIDNAIYNAIKATGPKPLTDDEQEKVDHLLNDLDGFLQEHPDLAEEASGGLESVFDHVEEAKQFMQGVQNDIAHLEAVRRSRNEEAQQQIDLAIQQAQEWLEQMQDILDGNQQEQ